MAKPMGTALAHKRASPEFAEAKIPIETLLNTLSAHVALIDGRGTITFVNAAWMRFAREGGLCEPDGGVGTNYLDACTSATDHEGHSVFKGLSEVLWGGRATFRQEYRCGERWFRMRAQRLDGDDTRAVVAHEDVTEARVAEAGLAELSRRLLTVQEQERRNIARELHDSTSQHLVAIGLELIRLRQADERSSPKIVDGIADLLDQAMREIRISTYLLHPPGLDSAGLEATLTRFATGFACRTGLALTIRTSPGISGLAPRLQRAVLRVVQEALSNVHRHAFAARISVQARLRGDVLLLRVRDDGRGVSEARLRAGADEVQLGVGIPGMRARLAEFGGRVVIRSRSPGTTVLAIVPAAPLHE